MKFSEWKAIKGKERVRELVECFGDPAKLAKVLGLSYTTVKSWNDRGRISRAGAKLVEEKTKGRFTADYLMTTADEWFSSDEWRDATLNGGRNGSENS